MIFGYLLCFIIYIKENYCIKGFAVKYNCCVTEKLILICRCHVILLQKNLYAYVYILNVVNTKE